MRPSRLIGLALIAFAFLPSSAGAATTLHAGDHGQRVTDVQRRLVFLSYLPRTSGRYDEATYHAVMAFQKRNGLARDGVAGPATIRALARGRRPEARKTSWRGQWIEVSLRSQTAVLVTNGRVVRTISIASGVPGYATPAGTWRVYRKERMSWSIKYKAWMPLASYYVGGYAVHQGVVGSGPASHGCVRVPAPFSATVYRWLAQGNRVHVR